MAITLEGFREAVSTRRQDRKRGARRYEAELVAFAVQHAEAVVARGRTVHAASTELGISMTTLQTWQQRSTVSARATKLRKVIVSGSALEASKPAPTVKLTTSDGHVVSGLDVAQVAVLLRALR